MVGGPVARPLLQWVRLKEAKASWERTPCSGVGVSGYGLLPERPSEAAVGQAWRWPDVLVSRTIEVEV